MAALFSAIVWGVTFVSTKALLGDFEPVEILIIRMSIGFLVLCVLCPRLLHVTDRRQEIWFAAAGLCGICLYYLLENIALTYTMASNVGVIVAVAPFFTAMVMQLVERSTSTTMTVLPEIWLLIIFPYTGTTSIRI